MTGTSSAKVSCRSTITIIIIIIVVVVVVVVQGRIRVP